MASASIHAPAAGSGSGAVTSAATIALVGRILIAAIFVLSGASKITQPGATIGYMTAAGLPFAPAGLVIAALIELGGGIGLIFGYRTRLAASVLAAFALVTAFVFHSGFSDQNQFIHFFKNVAVAGGLLQIAAFGAGRLSLDALRGRSVA